MGHRMPSLVEALRSPACYPHRARGLDVRETHISWVVLAGDYAYKVKKPVRFPFLDFSTLEARHFFCEEEVRVNRRTAPEIYLDVVPITGAIDAPFVNGPGPAIEYAVRMRRFSDADLLDRRAHEGRLGPADIDALASEIAAFHEMAAVSPSNSPCGSPALILEQALDNFLALEALEPAGEVGERLARLHAWTREEHARRKPRFEARGRDGFVREGHGDLHLGNVVFVGGVPRPFDAIEFDPRLREIDVMSDLAFLLMDLGHHGLPRLSARLFDRYVQRTGDFGGLAVLRFYLVYRAMVRAKVASLRAHQPDGAGAHAELRAHLDQALAYTRRREPMLILMHGLSGSGKTTVSGRLLEALSAVRLRSDVERRRVFGELPAGNTGSPLLGGLYDPAATDATYARLYALAHGALPEGWPVIVDATFIERSRREAFRDLARRQGAGFAIVSCEASSTLLRERLRSRALEASDASEADLAVLELQRARAQPLEGDELEDVIAVGPRAGDVPEAIRALLRRL